MSSPPPPVQRLRLRYGKTGDARWVGHLDEGRFWERVFRRVDLPLAYSHGFNPQPKVQFAAALPVGVAGVNELVDVWLLEAVDPDAWAERIGLSLPPGWVLHEVRQVPLDLPAMQSSLRLAAYEVRWGADLSPQRLKERVAWLLAQTTLVRPHHKESDRSYDLRPLIERMVVATADAAGVDVTLHSGPERSGRITEVVAALEFSGIRHEITRTALILVEDME